MTEPDTTEPDTTEPDIDAINAELQEQHELYLDSLEPDPQPYGDLT